MSQETIEPFHSSVINDDVLSPESIIRDSEAIAGSGAGLRGLSEATTAPEATTENNESDS